MSTRIHFTASQADHAQQALSDMVKRYGHVPLPEAQAVVALGGDGFMLQTLHAMQGQGRDLPVYGMNRGTVGFLMNAYAEDGLHDRLAMAEETVINPLQMRATRADGTVQGALAINEVSLLREGPQAAKLRIHVDGKMRMEELVCDGVLVSTPAGSTAYNYSAHGPILPIRSEVLALTAIAPFRPRRWRGALLPKSANVVIEVLNPHRRPVMADADSRSVRHVTKVEVSSAQEIRHRLLFDSGHGLEERLLREQFV